MSCAGHSHGGGGSHSHGGGSHTEPVKEETSALVVNGAAKVESTADTVSIEVSENDKPVTRKSAVHS